MSVLRIDMDNPSDVAILTEHISVGEPQVIPRRFRYGDATAFAKGIVPVEAVPDVLIPKDSYKEVLARCWAEKSLPIHHMYASWCPPGTRWYQNGLKYCWTWSGTACQMTVEAAEGKPCVQLAPVSMGWLVNWNNQGYFLDEFLQGSRDKGIAPAEYIPNSLDTNYRKYKPGWDTERTKHRMKTAWDTNPRAGDDVMTQHCLSILAYGRPLHGAWNHLAHAMAIKAMRWEEGVFQNLVWIIRNSHNETDVIEMTGKNAVPDEAIGYIDTELTE